MNNLTFPEKIVLLIEYFYNDPEKLAHSLGTKVYSHLNQDQDLAYDQTEREFYEICQNGTYLLIAGEYNNAWVNERYIDDGNYPCDLVFYAPNPDNGTSNILYMTNHKLGLVQEEFGTKNMDIYTEEKLFQYSTIYPEFVTESLEWWKVFVKSKIPFRINLTLLDIDKSLEVYL
ncbi:hypothetical protein BZF66_06050 [Salmonella enterica]|nr:hypothetical protein CPT_Munch_058 [Salmonella phage Munch]EAZ2022856.1 hypothetical protein [Salmonella enterica]EHX8550307.1 hypothetical protein [Salmonella enterica]MCP0435910.1 hypothetical protein [Salmonella enterica subsp. enterica serovar Mbandaka]